MNTETDIFDEYTTAVIPPAKESVLMIHTDNGAANPGASSRSVEDVNGAVSTSRPAEVVVDSPRPLFNGRQPAYTLQSERPEHRLIIMLKAAGRTNVEIAEATGTTAVHVATIVKQKWAVEQILREIEGAGREPVIELMQGAAVDATMRLIEIAQGAKNEETKRKANLNLIEFTFGKPNQPLSVTQKREAGQMTEAEIDAELAELRARRHSN